MEGNTFHTSSNTINSAVPITENMINCFLGKHRSKSYVIGNSLIENTPQYLKYTAVSKNQLNSLCYMGDI